MCCQWGIPHVDVLMYLDPPDIRDTELYNEPQPIAGTGLTGARPAADRKRPLEDFLQRNMHASRNAVLDETTLTHLYDETRATDALRPHIAALCEGINDVGTWDPESTVGAHWRRELAYTGCADQQRHGWSPPATPVPKEEMA